MRKTYFYILISLLLISGCSSSRQKETPPSADPNAVYQQCIPGTIKNVFFEGSGDDQAEVIALEINEEEQMYFTLVDSSEFQFYYPETGETAPATKADLIPGAWVEIECESHQSSGLNRILTVSIFAEEISAADTESPDIPREPPVLTILYDGSSYPTLQGTSTWFYTNGDGTETGLCSDSLHPLNSKAYMPAIPLQPGTFSETEPPVAQLQFEIFPDEVCVRCWKDSDWDNTEAEYEEILTYAPGYFLSVGEECHADLFVLKTGNYVYEVIAHWNGYDSFGGTASYSFFTTWNQASVYPD